uniref:Uncharacterized protein n=1 Tax=Ixodes ricinus TaxID=34613 RepID=V5HI87_IXORI
MNQEQAQREVYLELLSQIDPAHSAPFILWIQRRYLIANCAGVHVAEAVHKNVADSGITCKTIIPGDAILPSENIIQPTKGENADCRPETTVHVDAFLYSDCDIDQLVEEGKLSRNYCKACGSRDVAPLTFISHSASGRRAQFIFRNMVPYMEGKSVLDVGSRLGVMLYAAHAFTPANPIIGIEINPDFCQLQENVIKHFQMDDRIKIMNTDVRNAAEVVSAMDVVILNNVFVVLHCPSMSRSSCGNF